MRKFAIPTLVVALLASLLSVSAQDPTDTPTEPPPDTSPQERLIRVWWPDTLYALDDEGVSDIIENQVEDFNRLNPNYNGEVRIKRSDGQGSALSTLLAAQQVAPSAIPDLVLLKRSDLVQAARNGVITPIDDWVPDAIRDDVLPGIINLGEVDGTLYGLPYTVTIQHAIYDLDVYDTPPTSFADVLESEQPFLIPALPPPNQEANDILLGQYLSAGGRLVDNAGVPALDEEALREVLTFYEEGLQNGTFAAELLAYAAPSDYASRLTQGNIPLAIVDSTLYLQEREDIGRVGFAPIPTADGENMVIVDGWLWALATEIPEQQRGALAFLEAFVSAEPLADYTEAFSILPARQRSLRIWSLTSYTQNVIEWLDSIVIIPIDQRNNTAAQQLHAAFLAVIEGTPVNEAAEDALAGLSTSG